MTEREERVWHSLFWAIVTVLCTAMITYSISHCIGTPQDYFPNIQSEIRIQKEIIDRLAAHITKEDK